MDANPPQQQNDQNQGGGGGFEIDPHHVRRDLQMLARFPINPAVRAATTNRVSEIAVSPQSSVRNRLAAAKVLAQFDRINLEQERRLEDRPDVQVNVTHTTQVTIAQQQAAMDATILPVEVLHEAARRYFAGQGKQGSGNGNGNGNGKEDQ